MTQKIVVVETEKEKIFTRVWKLMGKDNRARRRNFLLFFWLPLLGLVAYAIKCGVIQSIIQYFAGRP